MSANQPDRPMTSCPDCGSELNLTLPGFRPATESERARLDPSSVHILGMCPNPACPAKGTVGLPRHLRG